MACSKTAAERHSELTAAIDQHVQEFRKAAELNGLLPVDLAEDLAAFFRFFDDFAVFLEAFLDFLAFLAAFDFDFDFDFTFGAPRAFDRAELFFFFVAAIVLSERTGRHSPSGAKRRTRFRRKAP